MKYDVFKFEDSDEFAKLVAGLQRHDAMFHTRHEGNTFIVVVYSSYTN